jgi:hypothetical protein
VVGLRRSLPAIALAFLFACGTLSPAPDDLSDGTDAQADSAEAGTPSKCTGDPIPASAPRYVFVTSGTYVPVQDFKSIAAADAICMSVAAKGDAKLSGHCFIAWLSDGSTSPSTRFVKATGDYVRTDGMVIANGWAGLTNGGTHASTVDVHENASSIDSAKNANVWTGTQPNGDSANEHCTGWSVSGGSGETGQANAKDGNWSDDGTLSCNGDAHFYCFEK